MSEGPDLIATARTALAASSTAHDPEIAGYYAALARTAFTKAAEELRTIEHVLVARERELATRTRPKQLDMPPTDTK
jgi:hypothetical protein